MAEPVTKRQIEQLVVTPYAGLRDSLKTGDLVFCSGSYLFSRLIQRFTGSVWSHVGILYKDDTLQRVFVLESETMIGVRLAPLSKYLKDYHGRNRPYRGNIVIARVQPEVDSAAMNRAISFGMDELTKPYDNLEILRIALRILLRISRRTRDRKYICSELVFECFKRAGVNFKLHDAFVSPDDIWQDSAVHCLQRVV